MRYCINPDCRERLNTDEAIECKKCTNSLLISNSERPSYNIANDRSYRIIKRLKYNPSACTEIFEVEDLEPGNSEKIKILKAIHDNDITYNGEKIFTLLTRLFQREQRFLYFNENEGIPRGYDVFSHTLKNEKKIHCLVMEKIVGVNLEQWLHENGAIKEKRALKWLEQIVKILDSVHENDFFHRDIKPSNIMWRKSDYKLVLIDFGAVKEINGTIPNANGEIMTTQVGTFGYVAPEQDARKAVPQSDFYSLGRTFVYLLTGKHPVYIEPISKWETQIRHPISQQLIDLINDLIKESPNERPQNTQIILQRLDIIKNSVNENPIFPSSKLSVIMSQMKTLPPQVDNPSSKLKNLSWLIKSSVIALGIGGLIALVSLFMGRNTQPTNKNTPPISPTSKNI